VDAVALDYDAIATVRSSVRGSSQCGRDRPLPNGDVPVSFSLGAIAIPPYLCARSGKRSQQPLFCQSLCGHRDLTGPCFPSRLDELVLFPELRGVGAVALVEILPSVVAHFGGKGGLARSFLTSSAWIIGLISSFPSCSDAAGDAPIGCDLADRRRYLLSVQPKARGRKSLLPNLTEDSVSRAHSLV